MPQLARALPDAFKIDANAVAAVPRATARALGNTALKISSAKTGEAIWVQNAASTSNTIRQNMPTTPPPEIRQKHGYKKMNKRRTPVKLVSMELDTEMNRNRQYQDPLTDFN
jgi:hypothetical protein